MAEVGRGGMGIVHKAFDHKLERHVALKILPGTALGRRDGDALLHPRGARHRRAQAPEHRRALRLRGRASGAPTWRWSSSRDRTSSPSSRTIPSGCKRNWRDWFVQAARGIAAAHAKGILHRDLKPANLVLDEHGILRILDFGLARPEADSGSTSKLIGTPAFFPPEVLRGEAASAASDVYSLGATFYTLAAGRWPYVGDDVLVARLERDPDDPRPYAPWLREDEVAVLLRSIARHRPERYQDGGELLGALLSLEA